jgi:hypothetical protein
MMSAIMNIASDIEGRTKEPCSVQLVDRVTMAKTVDQALKYQGFCEPECTLIVQIVCDALVGRPETEPGMLSKAVRLR